MDCVSAREAISATLDGEDPGVAAEAIEQHLAGCRSCVSWQQSAAEVTRMARLAPAMPVPDLGERALAGFRPARRAAWRGWLRLAVGITAVGQLAVVAGQFVLGAPAHAMSHLLHETAAFNLALAVALLWVAARPGRARSQWPVLLSVCAALAALSVLDLVRGDVGWGRLGTHLPLLAGALLTVLLGTLERRVPGPGGRAGTRGEEFVPASAPGDPAVPATPRRGQHQPPAAERAA
ncbi:zf-HC2 domain-containing protein [Prauserella muralis]|uniref:Putative zinc-finger domain-containing protein n=1 Tax=Prauserella muralis TaxID=588067 RepID=A0A2V4AMC8_9PSEU|nr:zf-HC2 domain-containing protein [Prauserella muralis]PXY21193.1 hypothetical protein BAY60_27430 [Prauserella muralis]TWE30295.1 putative anti-sigma-YlaC factor YlaD [Prauserella muralis]